MNVIPVPASLDYRTFDQFAGALSRLDAPRTLFDGRHLRFVDPFGVLGLLAAGAVVRDRQGNLPRFHFPEQSKVLSYLARVGFFDEAEGIFEMDTPPPRRGGDSDVLLEITPISTHGDVHTAVDRAMQRAGRIIVRQLHYPQTAVVPFSVVLSEVCQNIIEHAEAPGWVSVQRYDWEKRLGRSVVILAVVDVGRGFKGSLADEHATRFGDRWGDATALEAAFHHGFTRFPDSGRGHGIQQMRKRVGRWDGLLSIRSGTARIADVPSWDDSPPLEEGLPRFPGAQINIILPERLRDGASVGT